VVNHFPKAGKISASLPSLQTVKIIHVLVIAFYYPLYYNGSLNFAIVFLFLPKKSFL